MKKKILKAAVLCAAAAMMTAGAAMTAMAENWIMGNAGYEYNADVKWKLDDGDWTDAEWFEYFTTEDGKEGYCYAGSDKPCPKGWHWIVNGSTASCYYILDNGVVFEPEEKFDYTDLSLTQADADEFNRTTFAVTPDGYTVNVAGQWIVDGVVQEKHVTFDAGAGEEAKKLLATKSEEKVYDGLKYDTRSLAIMDMLGKTRAENKKYGEVIVQNAMKDHGDRIYVKYENGEGVAYYSGISDEATAYATLLI